MNEEVAFTLKGRNPDVLSCIANLSNDEVFTPPEFANRMLDTLEQAWAGSNSGASVWSDKAVTFLDPCTKSGVFLREITRRLIRGLETEIPDLQERVDHILTKQVFGIGITQITALLARRSLYCSKHAAGEHSVAKGFTSDDGNIWFERIEHTWVGGRCSHCGASQAALDRGDEAENYAYAFGLPKEKRFDQQVSGQKPFGLRTFFRGATKKLKEDDLTVLQSGGRAWVARADVTEGTHLVDKWKVFTSKSSAEHAGQVDKNGMRKVLSLSGVLPPGSVVTETYVLIGVYDTESEARNCFSYAATRFFRFLVAARASAQDLPRAAYSFVPVQDFSRPWSDADLYAKYGLDRREIELIESTIRPMDATVA